MDAQNATTVAGDRFFLTTHWSVVLAAQRAEPAQARPALEELCRVYWRPLYGYVRRRGYTHEDARDLTQEFFQRLTAPDFLTSVSSDKGKFRSFLLTSLNNFLTNEWHRIHAQKRGGYAQHFSIEADFEDDSDIGEGSAGAPEEFFDKRWALTVLERALAVLREEFATAGKTAQFDALKPYLTDVSTQQDYEPIAAKLNMRPSAVAVAVHRLRKRYRELVRGEVAQTVNSDTDLDSEMNYLLSVLSR